MSEIVSHYSILTNKMCLNVRPCPYWRKTHTYSGMLNPGGLCQPSDVDIKKTVRKLHNISWKENLGSRPQRSYFFFLNSCVVAHFTTIPCPPALPCSLVGESSVKPPLHHCCPSTSHRDHSPFSLRASPAAQQAVSRITLHVLPEKRST